MVCPVFRAEPLEALTARGRMFLLGHSLFAEKPSRHFQDIFSRCLLCGACEQVCSRNLPIRTRVIEARSRLPWLYGKHGLKKNLVRRILGSFGKAYLLTETWRFVSRSMVKYGIPKQPPVLDYFTGCTAGFLQPSIGRAVKRLTTLAGYSLHIPASRGCCGLTALAAGKIDQARELAWRNIKAFSGSDRDILTSCASCSSHLSSYPELFKNDPEKYEPAREFSERVQEFSGFFLNKTPSLTFKSNQPLTVFYHDPCHLRFTQEGREVPRLLLNRVVDLQLAEPEEEGHCCGHGGLFQLGSPELSGKIFNRCQSLALTVNPQIITTTCSGCLRQWQQGVTKHNLPVTVRHLALLLDDCVRVHLKG